MKRAWKLSLFMTVVLMMGTAAVLAGEDSSELKVGDKAPLFESIDDNGMSWKSSDHVGNSILVVYFFPAAMTGG